MARTIYVERIPSTDPRLRRNVRHDTDSRAYELDTTGLEIVAVDHPRRIPLFNQGDLGCCVACAGLGVLGTGPLYDALVALAALGALPYPLTDPGTVANYVDLTQVDEIPGFYRPGDPASEDTGSDGLSEAKLLQKAGIIPGYLHTFTLDDALKGLSRFPFMTGTYWTADMYRPDAEGIVHPTGKTVGGHEYVGACYVPSRGLVGFDQSWGRWGYRGTGRFYMPAEEYGALLKRNGDVTFLLPPSVPAPAPQPSPAAAADTAHAALLHAWLATQPHFYRGVQRDARAWLAAREL